MNLKSRPWIIGGIIVLLFVVGMAIVLESSNGGVPGVATPGATSQIPISEELTQETLLETPTEILHPPSSTATPVTSVAGSSICFIASKSLNPFDKTAQKVPFLQCAPFEDNHIDLDNAISLGGFSGASVSTVEASPNGQWLAVTVNMEGPSLPLIFETTTGQAVSVEPKNFSYPYYSFEGWGSDGSTAVLSSGIQIDIFNLRDQHEDTENLPSATTYGVALAPDGQYLAYAQEGQSSQSGGLYIKKRGSSDQPLSFIDPDAILLKPRWSPAGHILAFLRAPNLVQSQNSELWVVDDTLKSPRKLSGLAVGYPSIAYTSRWSPDGRWLAFVVWDHPEQVTDDPATHTGNIYIADSATGDMRALTKLQGVWTDWPSWSPDGKWIVFSQVANGASDLWTVEVATGKLQQVTSGANARYPVWLAHGAPVLPTPTPRNTTTPAPPTPTYQYSPTPSPTAVLGPLTMLQTKTTEGLSIQFYHLPEANIFSGIAIGAQVVLTDNFARSILIDLAKPDAPGTVIGNHGRIKAAPQARALVYSLSNPDSLTTRQWPLAAWHLDDGHETPLGNTTGYSPLFSPSSNGKVLMLEDHLPIIKDVRTAERKPLSGVEETLGDEWKQIDLTSPDPFVDISLSPDAQRVAVAYGEHLRLLTVDGAPILGIDLPISSSVRFLNWSLDGEYLAYTHSVNYVRATPILEILDLKSGTSIVLEPPTSDPPESIFDLAWSPAGAQIAFITVNSSEESFLYVADSTGNNTRRLGEVASGYIVWTPEHGILYPCINNEIRGLCSLTLP